MRLLERVELEQTALLIRDIKVETPPEIMVVLLAVAVLEVLVSMLELKYLEPLAAMVLQVVSQAHRFQELAVVVVVVGELEAEGL